MKIRPDLLPIENWWTYPNTKLDTMGLVQNQKQKYPNNMSV